MAHRSTVAQSKDAERDIASVMGGRRLHAGEWDGPGDLDVHGGWWVAQVKHRSDVPKWFREGVAQAVEAAESLHHRPMPLLVIVTKPGPGRKAEMFVTCRVEEWLSWNGKGDRP